MFGGSLELALRVVVIVTALIVLIVAFGAGLAVGRWLWPACPDCADSEEAVKAFYAGVYALCFDTSGSVTTCDNTVRHLYRERRHKSPSPGFDWPPLETANDGH